MSNKTKIESITNFSRNLHYLFKTNKNITKEKLEKEFYKNSLNIENNSLINLLLNNNVIYEIDNNFKLLSKYDDLTKLNQKLHTIKEFQIAQLIINFNLTHNETEEITSKELTTYLLNYTNYNQTINEIIKYLIQEKILFQKDEYIIISLEETKETKLKSFLKKYKNINQKELIKYLKNNTGILMNEFIEDIINVTEIINTINELKTKLEETNNIYNYYNNYIIIHNKDKYKPNTKEVNMDLKELINQIKTQYTTNQTIEFDEIIKLIKNNYTQKTPQEILEILEEEEILYSIDNKYKIFPNYYKVKTIEASSKGNPYIIYKNNTYLIKKENLNGALPNDKVIVHIDERKKPITIKVVKIIKRNSSPILCQIIEKENKKILVPHNVKGVLNLKVNINELSKLQNGDFILVKPDKEKINDKFNCELVSDKIILTDSNLSPALVMIALEHECNPEYSKECYKEIKQIPTTVSEKEIKKRKNHDFRNKKIFTIDGISTQDMDDAIGIEQLPNGNFEITVNIAEPNYYVKEGTALYQEAHQRKFSMYLLNTAIHMFHPALASGICSLNENQDRLTKSVVMEIDNNGNIINSKICKAVINSKKKMNYDDVNSILENDITPYGYENFETELKQMKTITDKIWENKEKEGLLTLDIKKNKLTIDNQGEIIITEEKRGAAEKLIEILMILANVEVATLMTNSPYPGIYRVHEEPDHKKIYELCDKLKEQGYDIDKKEIDKDPRIIKTILDEAKKLNINDIDTLSTIILQSFKRARYTTNRGIHWALNLHKYTHYTSPIRRFEDFVVHTQIDRLFKLKETDELQIRKNYNEIKYEEQLDPKEYILMKEEMEEDAREATRKEKLYDQAENEAAQLLIIETLKKKIGTSYKAVIQLITPNYIEVKTSEGINGIIYYNNINGDIFDYREKKKEAIGRNTKQIYRVGNTVNVTLQNINEYTNEIEFTLNYKYVNNINNKPKTLTKK